MRLFPCSAQHINHDPEEAADFGDFAPDFERSPADSAALMPKEILASKSPNQALERTATRRVSTFQMIETVSVEAKPALGAGRSACSR